MEYLVAAGIAIVVCHLVFCWVTSLLRCYTRVFLVKSFWIDDWLSLLSLIIFTAYGGIYLNEIFSGITGRHIVDFTSATMIQKGLMELYLCETLYNIGTCVIKISFAVTLLRVVRAKLHIYMLYFIMFVVTTTSTFVFFYVTFFCTPISYQWTKAVDPYTALLFEGVDPATVGIKPRGSCKDQSGLVSEGYAQLAVMVFSDASLGILMPILLLKDLQMRRSLKITSGIILGLGCITSVASIVRIWYIHTLSTNDIFYVGQPLFMWSTIEYAWCLIATSCTTLKPLVNKFNLLKDFTTRNGTSRLESHRSVQQQQKPKMHGGAVSDVHMMYLSKPWDGASAETNVNSVIEAGDGSSRAGSHEGIYKTVDVYAV